jgi:protein ImuB
MSVPSYDDLTPGIPDEVDPKSVDQLTLFLNNSQIPTPNTQLPTPKQLPTPNSQIGNWELGGGNFQPLYACLRAASSAEKLAEVAGDFSPRIMRVSDGEVVLDVSGLGRLIGEPPAIAAALARALYDGGLTASVALAPTQTAARLLATQMPDCPQTQLPNLPVTLLQPLETLPPAINHRDRARPYETFERWGIHTLGDLAALPAAALSSRLGRRGVALQRLARGLDPRPFVPDGDTPRYIGRLELEWPIEALEPLSFVFARLLDPLSLALERADRGAAAIRLDLRLTTRDVHTRVLQLPAPMRDPKVLRTLLLLDLESRPPPSLLRSFGETSAVTTAVDVVTIELDPAPARITQFSLLERALPSPETLSTLTARLSALVGETRVGSAVLLDTHQPGAFEMTRFAPETRVISSRRSDEVAKADEMARFAPESQGAKGVNGARGADGPPSPLRGFGATGPPADESRPVLRRQRTPPAIRVRIEHGRPIYIAAAKRGMPQGTVVQAAGPWRTSGGWWSGYWNRDEWDVALTSGTVCRIYQDRTTERWFLEGIYD